MNMSRSQSHGISRGGGGYERPPPPPQKEVTFPIDRTGADTGPEAYSSPPPQGLMRIDQLQRERVSLVWPCKAIITTNILVMGVNFGGHFGEQNVQVSMLQNGMVTSCVQSAK